ncbi:ribosomal protein S10p/S20e-domain-containing protein [Jimgerdemannia flammicorona]|uniref:Ribosomal protein S10p/S20e-domain-containing protein n=1 Tax=Jimgerdemannia flammicorona TaxID=994334 RepID=A0A432ZYK2_9FUNG|nr:ribosomal protein S10p/S20e-domain-containing protein [Jimgerdemannia flammicorona]
MPCSGMVRLPTQRSMWTLLRSPFVHKKAQENFERRTHKRLLQVKDAAPEAVNRWLLYLRMNAPAGVGMRATVFEYEEVGVGQRMIERVELRMKDKEPALAREENVQRMAEELVNKLGKEGEGEEV